jgi:hypothetical protein
MILRNRGFMYKYFLVLLFIPLGLLLSSCRGKMYEVLNDPLCDAPCWREISMDMNKAEAIEVINKMPDIDEGSITISKTNRMFMQEVIHWKFKKINEYGNLIINDDKVAQFTFYPNKKISLSNLIKIYGQPSSVIILKGKLDGVYTLVHLIYNDQGICLSYQPALLPYYDPSTYLIKPSDRVKEIGYVDTSIPNWQTEFCTGLERKDSILLSQDWKGYQRYSVNPWP